LKKPEKEIIIKPKGKIQKPEFMIQHGIPPFLTHSIRLPGLRFQKGLSIFLSGPVGKKTPSRKTDLGISHFYPQDPTQPMRPRNWRNSSIQAGLLTPSPFGNLPIHKSLI